MPSLFKTIGAVVCLVFALCFAAPTAHADSLTDGTINFTVTSGSPAPTGSFVFDNTTSTFTSFTVGWDGVIYNFGTSGITLAELGSSGFWCAAGPVSLSPAGQAGVLRLEILVLPEAPDDSSDPFVAANGNLHGNGDCGRHARAKLTRTHAVRGRASVCDAETFVGFATGQLI
jgi:hypothetical protein